MWTTGPGSAEPDMGVLMLCNGIFLAATSLFLICAGQYSITQDLSPTLVQRASSGNVDAILKLAGGYESGLGVPQDMSKAAEWYRRAADYGNPVAQAKIGSFYHCGTGVEKDKHEFSR